MFTLKIYVARIGPPVTPGGPSTLDDESTHFYPCDSVVAHGAIRGNEVSSQMLHWGCSDYTVMLSDNFQADGSAVQVDGRLIEYTYDRVARWVIASSAWLLGPNGQTIERLV